MGRNYQGNRSAISNRCAGKTEASKAEQESAGVARARRASLNMATDVASGTNRVVLGHRTTGTTQVGGGSQAELVNAEGEETVCVRGSPLAEYM